MGKRNKEERERKRKRQGLYVVVERVGGGEVTVILATPTHILQPLPQWKKCFSAKCNYYRLQIGQRSIGGTQQNEMLYTVLCLCVFNCVSKNIICSVKNTLVALLCVKHMFIGT